MSKKYHINPDTLVLERVEQGFTYWLRRSGWYLLGGICLGTVFFFLFFLFFPSPKEKSLMQQKQNLEAELQVLNSQVDQMQLVLNDLTQRDDNLYRVLFGAEPIPLAVRLGAARKISYYEALSKMTNSQLTADLARKVDLLEKGLYVQAKSYDDLVEMAKDQEIKMENIPAIQPVMNTQPAHKPAAQTVVQPKPSPTIPKIPTIPTIPSVNVQMPNTKEQVAAPAQKEEPKHEENRPFTVDQFEGAWAGLKTILHEEPRLMAILAEYTPTLIDEEHCVLTLANPFQVTDFKKVANKRL